MRHTAAHFCTTPFSCQEIKCSKDKLPDEVTKGLKDYPYKYWFPSSGKEGYSGVGMLSKTEPLKVLYGFEGLEEDTVKVKLVLGL